MRQFRPTRVGSIGVLLGLLCLGAGYGSWAQTGGGAENVGDPKRAPGAAVGTSRPALEGAVAAAASRVYPRPGPGLNLLALEASPYLQLHAHNPVDWYPWGEEGASYVWSHAEIQHVLGAQRATDAEQVQTDTVESFRLPRSEDHVRARLVRPASGNPSELVVRMTIDEGWHVNANPASLPYLIATAVEVIDENGSAMVRYPAGQSFRPEYADAAIQVYEGTLKISVALEDRAHSLERLALLFQACDSSVCLPPHRTVLTLEASAEAAP